MADAGRIERAEDINDECALAQRELTAAKKFLEKFHTQGDKVVDRYLDEREGGNSGATWFNLFWSNVNVLKATLYARQPKADVSRRNKDPGDDEGRVAGEMVERILNLDMDSQTSDVDMALRQCIEDRLLPGMGQVWLRYDPTFVMQDVPVERDPTTGTPLSEPKQIEVIGDERVATDYVYWKDFLWSPARTWREVRWVARALYMTRAELIERFSAQVGNDVPLNASSHPAKDAGQLKDDPWQKAVVWEMWFKATRTVVWLVDGYDKLLNKVADPLELQDFFPCPQPLVANTTTKQFIPKADYEMVRDQYVEIDVIAQRISLLEDAVRVVGCYDKTNSTLAKMVGGSMNEMIPVDNWAMFAEKGGIKGTVDWFPLDMVVAALDKLREAKAMAMQAIYDLTGLSDIMRGASVASETATAQQLKAQYGSVRMQFMQGALGAFVQQLLAIKAEIIATHFQPDTIKRQSLIQFTPDAQLADAAIQRLKDKRMAMYSLTVDPDTMAQIDYAAEQEARTNCINAVAQFMTAAGPLVQMKPEATPFLLQILQWFMASFKAGKQIEGVLDQAVRQIGLKGQQPDPQQQAMKSAQLRKVQAEGKEKESAAIKNIADARSKGMDAVATGVDTLQAAGAPPQTFEPPAPPGGAAPPMPGAA